MTQPTPRHPKLVNRDREMIPRALIRAMFALALISLALVSYARITDQPLVGQPLPAPVTKERLLALTKSGESTFAVIDEKGGKIAEYEKTDAGFVAVVYAGLARTRMQHGVEMTTPLRLAEHENGRLSLHDDATGWHVELASFGASNRAAFAKLLD